jgi:hypothetical protein
MRDTGRVDWRRDYEPPRSSFKAPLMDGQNPDQLRLRPSWSDRAEEGTVENRNHVENYISRELDDAWNTRGRDFNKGE